MFGAEATFDNIGQSSFIEHAHVILVMEAPELVAHHTHRHRLVPYIHRVVHPRDVLGCVAQRERVHLRAQADKLDDQISLRLVLQITQFSGV